MVATTQSPVALARTWVATLVDKGPPAVLAGPSSDGFFSFNSQGMSRVRASARDMPEIKVYGDE